MAIIYRENPLKFSTTRNHYNDREANHSFKIRANVLLPAQYTKCACANVNSQPGQEKNAITRQI